MTIDKTSLGDRIKLFENAYRFKFTSRMPLILRLDGKAFSNYTKSFEKPFDIKIRDAFIFGTKALFKEISGIKISYQQSDELQLLITDYDTFNTKPWFDNNIQKIISVSSSIFTASFNKFMWENKYTDKIATFDSRGFIVSKEEVCNSFLFRQRDASRNSVSSLAHKHFSHKLLQGKSTKQMQEILFQEKEINWNDIDTWKKRGYCLFSKSIEKSPGIIRNIVEPDFEIPIFSEDRNYINKFVYIEKEIKQE